MLNEWRGVVGTRGVKWAPKGPCRRLRWPSRKSLSRLDCAYRDTHKLEGASLAVLPRKTASVSGLAVRKGATPWGARTSLLDTESLSPKPAKQVQILPPLSHAVSQENKAGTTSTGGVFKAPDLVAFYGRSDSLSRRLPNNPALAAPIERKA